VGKRYIIINGKRVYIQKGVSKRQVISLYSTLLKGIQPSKKERATNINNATAVINNMLHNQDREIDLERARNRLYQQ